MRLPCFRPLSFLRRSSLLLLSPVRVHSQDQSVPQLVRLSYAQGEVKFSPGKNGKPDLGTEWLLAPEGLTLEEGYSVATEDGRAIVEFENGSLVYLAEHSVLQFNKLQLKAGAATSRLYLPTGTATLAHVSNGHDQMSTDTPTAKLIERSTQTLRIDSTLNGTVVQAINRDVPINETAQDSKSDWKPGESVAYVDGFRIQLKGPMGQPENDGWDKWVGAARPARGRHPERSARVRSERTDSRPRRFSPERSLLRLPALRKVLGAQPATDRAGIGADARSANHSCVGFAARRRTKEFRNQSHAGQPLSHGNLDVLRWPSKPARSPCC